jgi:hypothetical protein
MRSIYGDSPWAPIDTNYIEKKKAQGMTEEEYLPSVAKQHLLTNNKDIAGTYQNYSKDPY